MATVDTEAILLSDVMMELGPYMPELQQRATSETEFNRLVESKIRETLQQAIDNRILLRQAMLQGLAVNDDVVEDRLTEIKDMYPSPDAFTQELEQTGETVGELRSRLRKQLLARKVAMDKRDEFARSITVSESEVAQYYEDHRGEFERPERIRVRQIFLVKPNSADQQAVVRARMEQIEKELEAGAAFADLAEAHSQAPGAEDGGIIGWISRGDLVAPLDEAAFALSSGETSGIIETDNGLHILRVDERQEAGLASLEEVRTEIEPMIRAEEASGLYARWIEDLRDRSRVRVFYR